MPRIPYPKLTPEQQAEFDKVPINLNLACFHVPENLHGTYSQFGFDLLFSPSYDAKLRELIILRVGFLSDCEYEVFQHRGLSKQFGVPEEKVEAALQSPLGQDLSDKEVAVLDFVTDTLLNVKPSDKTLDAVQEYLSASEIAETVLIVGAYMMVARIIETFGVELDSEDNIVKNRD